MNTKLKWGLQLIAVVACSFGLKQYYSTASPDELRWILAPTTWLVELLSGRSFSFESNAGYMSSDHSFLIAASCAGVNFLITAFLMLGLKQLWHVRYTTTRWHFLPLGALMAYLATLCANTVRICTALELQNLRHEITWLSPAQLHRVEGILIYFGFLLFLFMLTERTAVKDGLLRQALFPLFIYYGTTLLLPLLNGAYQRGSTFWEHSAFVVAIPLLLMVPIPVLRLCRRWKKGDLSFLGGLYRLGSRRYL